MSDLMPINPPLLSREEIAERLEKHRQILRRLDDRDGAVRQQTIQECQTLPAREICALMSMAQQTEEWSLPHCLKYVLNVTIAILLFTFAIATVIAFNQSSDPWAYILTCALLVAVSCGVNRPGQVALYPGRVREDFAEIVREVQDPAFLPEAMRLLYISGLSSKGFTGIEAALYENAAHWLLLLNHEEIREFAIQQQGFYVFLTLDKVTKDVKLSIHILAFLEKYGTPSAISTVVRLAQVIVFSDKQRAVKTAAQSCLAALEQRARESRQPETLLRASSAPSDTPAVLLRPAEGSANETLPAQLLRSADSGKT